MPTIVLFTVVPDPRDLARVTVLVSPRLTGDPRGHTLDEFALGDWPTRIDQLTGIELSFDGGASYASAQLAPPSANDPARRDAGLWRRVFPGSTPVAPWRFDDDRQRAIKSFPAAQLARDLLGVYRDVARLPDPFEHPRFDPATASGPLERLVYDLRRVDANVRLELGEAIAPPIGTHDGDGPGAMPTRAVPYAQALRFYRRPPELPHPEPQYLPLPTVPELDFHDAVSALADHPVLQRKLGLVFDVVIPPGTAVPAVGSLRLRASWRGASVDDRFPRTRYQRSATRWLPQVRDLHAPLRDGYLSLGDARFEVVQVDVDGAALKTLDFATAARNLGADPRSAPIDSLTLPALRSGGVTLVQADRGPMMAAAIGRGGALADGDPGQAELFAEDLVRGYRIDVESPDGQWRSLCEREGVITVAGEDVPVPPGDEGYVKAATGTSSPAANDQEARRDLYLHEAVAGWDGWSLCARRPGRAIEGKTEDVVDNGTVIGQRHDEDVVETANEPGLIDVKAEYWPPDGSLPRLRFGSSYRLRARLVDVAGGGVPVDGNDSHATTPFVYQRYEPIASPVLALSARITEAESLEHVVIRSAPGQTPAEYAAAHPGHGYAATSSRHVLPPKTSLAMAETHGMLDEAFAAGGDPELWYVVATKEAGSLMDSEVVDLATGATAPQTGLTLCNAPSVSPPTAPLPTVRGAPLSPGQYVIVTGDEVRLPWLPDPLAAGVALWSPTRGADEVGPQVIERRYLPSSAALPAGLARWPERRSLRVELEGATGAAIVRDAPGGDARRVRFALPPGRTLAMRYSSVPDGDRVDQLAMWELADADRATERGNLIRAGLHWMFSPWRTLVLVHAVQRPVTAPKLVATTRRAPGDTGVRFGGTVETHSHSTSHVDVRASWLEPIDDPASPRPVRELRRADAFRVPIRVGEPVSSLSGSQVVVSRTPAQRTVAAPGGGQTDLSYLHRTEQHSSQSPYHELGDTRHRVLEYRPVGTTRYQEYFPAAVIADPANLESTGPTMLVSAPATAPPAPPQVLYLIPTFRWSGTSLAPVRRGGVRIYLDRPWFSSGDGERLGIVLSPHPADITNEFRPYVSIWGRDPVWSGAQPTPLQVSSFLGFDEAESPRWDGSIGKRLVVVAAAQRLAENNREVIVVAVEPMFDEQRRLWYCDVELATGDAYFPFLSLALVRYQANALLGSSLSTVVRAEWIQVAPDRSASWVPNGNVATVSVTGVTAGNALEWLGPRTTNETFCEWIPGRPPRREPREVCWSQPSHAGTPGAAHRVRARIERFTGAGAPDDDVLAWEAVGAPIELIAQLLDDSHVQWTASVPLPTPPGRYRAVITEAEIYNADAGVPVDMGGTFTPGGERVVYAVAFGFDR